MNQRIPQQETPEEAARRIERYKMESRAALEEVLRAHHAKEMQGKAGGSAICACGDGCGTTLACAAYQVLLDTEMNYEGILRINEKLRARIKELETSQ